MVRGRAGIGARAIALKKTWSICAPANPNPNPSPSPSPSPSPTPNLEHLRARLCLGREVLDHDVAQAVQQHLGGLGVLLEPALAILRGRRRGAQRR